MAMGLNSAVGTLEIVGDIPFAKLKMIWSRI